MSREIVVSHDARWVTFSPSDNADEWVERTTAAVLERCGAGDDGRVRAQLAELPALAHRLEVMQMFALYPEVEGGVVAIVQLLTEEWPVGADEDEVLDALRIREDELVQPAAVSTLDRSLGRVLRLQQTYFDRTSEHRVVHDLVTYVWPEAAADGALLVASSTFLDRVALTRWAPDLDDLARGLRFVDVP